METEVFNPWNSLGERLVLTPHSSWGTQRPHTDANPDQCSKEKHTDCRVRCNRGRSKGRLISASSRPASKVNFYLLIDQGSVLLCDCPWLACPDLRSLRSQSLQLGLQMKTTIPFNFYYFILFIFVILDIEPKTLQFRNELRRFSSTPRHNFVSARP